MTSKTQSTIFDYEVKRLGHLDWHNSVFADCPFCGARRKIVYFENYDLLEVEWCQAKPRQEVCMHLVGLDFENMKIIYKK